MTRRVVVVGGGISGLATAHALVSGPGGDDLQVVVLEAGDRLGGKLRTSPFAGRAAVDEGADAFLARLPHATDLAGRVGLGESLTSPASSTAAVWYGRLHPIPDGLVLGVPAGFSRLAASHLLTWRGKLRAAVEPLLPRTSPDGDSIGAYVRSRFGHEVQERLVDALVGSIYAAETDRTSMSTVPQLAALTGHRSLLLAARRARRARRRQPTGPVFLAPRAGMEALATSVASSCRTAGADVRTGAPVTELAPDGGGWRVDGEHADAVVLATPARTTAPLLSPVAGEAARLMATMDHAGVVIVTIAVPDWPRSLAGMSGYLVPKPVQRTVTAVSFGSQKWAHWTGDDEVLRISLGRDGLPVEHLADQELVDRALDEVGRHLGVELQPLAVRVSRWPAAFPQYRPHHRDWVRRVVAALPDGLFVTGASYRGVGVPACVADASATAGTVAGMLIGSDR